MKTANVEENPGPINLADYKLLAEGGQAKIYLFSDDKVLRVPQRKMDYERIEYEFKVYREIQDRIPVPQVFELLKIDGVPSIVMERVKGMSLAKASSHSLLKMVRLPRVLATLHSRVFRVALGEGLVTCHQKASFCIRNSETLDAPMKDRLLHLLGGLAHGNTLCHGDFHPENILIDGKATIIDWSAATVGSKLFDIANTYLLMVNLPFFPSMGRARYELNRRITRWIGRGYLKAILKAEEIKPESLWSFFLICAAERTYYGQEEEKIKLTRFLTRYSERESFDLPKIRDSDFSEVINEPSWAK